MHVIEIELQKATKVKPKKGGERQDYLYDLAMKCVGEERISDDAWEALSLPAQTWANEAARALKADGQDIPDFPVEAENVEAPEQARTGDESGGDNTPVGKLKPNSGEIPDMPAAQKRKRSSETDAKVAKHVAADKARREGKGLKSPPSIKAKKTDDTTGKAPKKRKGESGAKLALIVALLKRKNGCTAKDVLEATGWPSVSMPAMAKAAGLKLAKEKKKGEVTRYRGA